MAKTEVWKSLYVHGFEIGSKNINQNQNLDTISYNSIETHWAMDSHQVEIEPKVCSLDGLAMGNASVH